MCILYILFFIHFFVQGVVLCKAIISRLLGQRKIVPLQVGNLPDIDRTSLAVKYHANIRETFFVSLYTGT